MASYYEVNEVLELNTFSLVKILQEISSVKPNGHDLREAKDASLNLYHTVKDLRHNARLNETQNAAAGETHFIKQADWEPIALKSYELLTQHSKDGEVASWFVESLVRLYSFEGLAFGFKVYSELIKIYSFSLYPFVDEKNSDDSDWSFLLFLSGLIGNAGHDGTLFTPIRCASFSQYSQYCLWQFQKAYELENIHEKHIKEEKIKNGAIHLESIKKDVEESDPLFLLNIKKNIDDSLKLISEMTVVIEEIFQNKQISFNGIKSLLNECQRTFAFLAGDSLENYNQKNIKISDIKVEEPKLQEEQMDTSSINLSSYKVVSTPVANKTENNPYIEAEKLLTTMNFDCIFNPQKYNAPELKEQTINLIRYLSQVIKVTDNLSPLPYFLDKAVHMSQLSFADVLNELKLSPREISADSFSQLTGIKLNSEPSKS